MQGLQRQLRNSHYDDERALQGGRGYESSGSVYNEGIEENGTAFSKY